MRNLYCSLPKHISLRTLSAVFACLIAALAVSESPNLRAIDAKDVKWPEIIKEVSPVYPAAMKDSNIFGKVLVRVYVDASGKITSPSPTVLFSSNPGFNQAAIDAVSKYKFGPGTVYGRPEKLRVVEWVIFNTIHGGNAAAEPTKLASPVLSDALRKIGKDGTVIVQFTVDIDGNVKEPTVVQSSNPVFEQAAIDAILKWKYRPAFKDGKPVNSRVRQEISFGFTN